jgi:2-amino-4-hydroxy-6-hydroxymethyldihydropteridine diphosphokinase
VSETAYIALGSNVGDRAAHFQEALRGLADTPGVKLANCSSLYETAAVGPEQPDYLNAVVVAQVDLEPLALLGRLRELERASGRVRRERWGPRTLDLDLLLYGERVVAEEGLTVPHPELHRRRFVLEPLVEVAPWAVHPLLAQSMDELLHHLPPGGVTRLAAPPSIPLDP